MITTAKRQFALLLLLALIVPLLAACGGAGSTGSATSAPAAATSAPAAAPTAAPAAATAEPVAAPTAAMAEPTAAMAEPTAAAGGATTGVVTLPEVDPATVTGNIISAGSSTVFPLTQRLAEKFKDEGYTGNITVDSVGTGAGFERFCKTGETDISNASRAIKKEEAENCAKLSPARTPVEFRVGTDALAVVVSAENTFVDNLTKAQLADIFSGKAATWDAVNPAWPKEKIQLFSPGTDSGTFDYFVESIMTPVFVKDPVADKDKGKQAILNAPGIQLSENDNVLAQGVEGSPYAIGYFGFAYFKEAAGKLKVSKVEGVEPDFDTAESGKYPLARPLFIYSDAKIMQDKPQVAAFINFYLTYVSDEIGDVGYFPASADALDAAKQNWLTAEGGAAAPAAPAGGATTGAVTLPEVDPATVTGNIISAGSSTVFPLTQRLAEKFKDEGYTGNITVDSVGTGAGFERFCKTGETDISNASRAIKKEEAENCAKLSPARTPVEFRVGTDALAVVVSAENTFVDNLTKAQLADIFSGKAATWDAVNPAWPKEKIQLFSPGTDSGTFDYFVESIMTPVFVKDPVADKDKGKQAILNAPGIQLSENDNVLAQGVEGSPYAIGYFGFAYFKEAAGKLKVSKVEGVEPDFDTAESGKYPLARPLFIYSDAKIMQDKPQVAAFINFYLTYVNDEIGDVGYFPASAEALDAAKKNWLGASE